MRIQSRIGNLREGGFVRSRSRHYAVEFAGKSFKKSFEGRFFNIFFCLSYLKNVSIRFIENLFGNTFSLQLDIFGPQFFYLLTPSFFIKDRKIILVFDVV